MSYAITGIRAATGPNGEVPVRREVNQWFHDPASAPQVSLFLLALQSFQEMDIHDKLSYFQVAGIHGQPYETWDVEPHRQGRRGEYCKHNGILFPTWHRAYLLLFEQRIHELMVRAIERYPAARRQQLRQAADTWRLPFWDTASAQVPDICVDAEISVDGPNGRDMIPNPMHKFQMPKGQTFAAGGISTPNEPSSRIRYDQTRATSRCPRPRDDWVNGTQNFDLVNTNLSVNDKDFNPRTRDTSIKEDVYRLLTYPAAVHFHVFATAQFISSIPKPGGYMSIESVHNTIHLWTGGIGPVVNPGHMTSSSTAAFDPIFWLHHNNVDRLFAIWQELHPNAWFDNVPGIPDRPTDGLLPFNKNTRYTPMTSNDVRDWTRLGYTYPELQRWLPEHQRDGRFDHQLYIDSIVEQINTLYGPLRHRVLGLERPLQEPVMHALVAAAPAIEDIATMDVVTADEEGTAGAETQVRGSGASGEAPSADAAESHIAPEPTVSVMAATRMEPDTEGDGPLPETGDAPSTETGGALQTAAEDKRHFIELPDYIVNVRYARMELDRGAQYAVEIYIGAGKGSTAPPTFAGRVVTFSSPLPEDDAEPHCENCEEQARQGTLSAGQVALTQALLDHIEDNGSPLQAIDPQAVIAYLKDRLIWKAIRITGEEIPLERLPSLKVSLAAGKVKYYTDGTSLPEYSEYHNELVVTEGKPNGLAESDTF